MFSVKHGAGHPKPCLIQKLSLLDAIFRAVSASQKRITLFTVNTGFIKWGKYDHHHISGQLKFASCLWRLVFSTMLYIWYVKGTSFPVLDSYAEEYYAGTSSNVEANFTVKSYSFKLIEYFCGAHPKYFVYQAKYSA